MSLSSVPVHIIDNVIIHILDNMDIRDAKGRDRPTSVREAVSNRNWISVVNFRLTSKRFDGIYRNMFGPRLGIMKLPFSVIDKIFIHLFEGAFLPGRGKKVYSRTTQEACKLVSKRSWEDGISLRLSNTRFEVVYQLFYEPCTHPNGHCVDESGQVSSRPLVSLPTLDALPQEILELILNHVSIERKGVLQIDNRSCLSLESYPEKVAGQYPDDGSSGGLQELKKLRFVSRKFDLICAERLFARISVRFSKRGFEILQNIALHPRLRGFVRKLTYMVPPFHVGGVTRFEEYLSRERTEMLRQRGPNNTGRSRLNKENLIKETLSKALEQAHIKAHCTDYTSILIALRSFKNLERIRLFRLMSQNDADWKSYQGIRYGVAYANAHLSWQDACEHAMKTLIAAFLKSESSATTFDCRFLDVRSPSSMTKHTLADLSRALERLDGLLVRFIDDRGDAMDDKVNNISRFCNGLLPHTKNLIGLHVAFERPVSITLESLFRDAKWDKMRYIGLHMWSLDADELIKLLSYLPILKSVRLRQVYLTEGEDKKRWNDVLKFIKTQKSLKWISLFGIGYGDGWNAQTYVNDDANSDSLPSDHEEEEDEIASEDGNEGEEHDAPMITNYGDSMDDESQGGSTNEDSGEEEEEEDNDDLDIDTHHNIHDHESHESPPSPVFTASADPTQCECEVDIGDNAFTIDQRTWREWEKWAVKRCPSHPPPRHIDVNMNL